ENIILDEHNNVQIIDFGSGAYVKEDTKFDTFCGTIDYISPEVFSGKKYDGPPQDIWALGVLLYTLIYKENPFYNIDEVMARDLRIPFILSEGSIDLVKKMLEYDVDKRLKIDEVLSHPWLCEN
ncbi:3164_t:CDS:2, partial [Entrophospora sp. SA101]